MKSLATRFLLAPLALVAMLVGAAKADVTIDANIGGNTVNYTVGGLEAGANYTVSFEHVPTGQSNPYDHTADDQGRIQASGTPGGATIHPGQSVRVSVRNSANQEIASKTITKPKPERWYRSAWLPWNWV